MHIMPHIEFSLMETLQGTIDELLTVCRFYILKYAHNGTITYIEQWNAIFNI